MKEVFGVRKIVLCGLFLGIAAMGFAEDAKPVGEWKFEEPDGKLLKDSSGSGNDGTISGPGDIVRVDGHSGKGIECKGEYLRGGAVVIPKLSEKCDYFKNGLTVETWIKFRASTDKKKQYEIISNTQSDNGKGFRLRMQGDWMYFSVGDGAKSVHAISDMLKNPLKPDQWYHIAAVYDAGKLKLFIDGELAAQSKQTINLDGGEKDVYIGAYKGGYAYRFDGFIDEVKIFNYARTDAQILTDARAE